MEHVKNYVKGFGIAAIMMLAISAVSFAAGNASTALNKGLGCLCGQMIELMPIICMLLVMAAGVVYAAGQVAGAETRARAAGYATAMILGAVVGIIITLILPPVMNAIYTNSGNTDMSGFVSTSGSFCQTSGNC